MLKFTVSKGKVIMDPKVLLIEEFTNIIKYYKGKKSNLTNELLLYVFFCCDLTEDNPMKDIDYRLKEEQANNRVFGKGRKKFNKEERELLDAAMDAYNFFNETSLERSAIAYDRKIDEIRSLLEEMKPEVHAVFDECICEQCSEQRVSIIDKYVSNSKEIENFAKQLSVMADYKLKAIENAKKLEKAGRVRGKKGSSMIERGTWRDKVDKRY